MQFDIKWPKHSWDLMWKLLIQKTGPYMSNVLYFDMSNVLYLDMSKVLYLDMSNVLYFDMSNVLYIVLLTL